jgi:hypothetical protein
LLYDIENAPMLAYVWEMWETNVIEVKEDWYILSVAYKWLDEKEVHVLSLPDFQRYKSDPQDDEPLVSAFHKIMEQADFLIAHNGDGFDFKKLQARMLQHGIPPPKPTKSIDTLKAARRVAKFASNKLDDLGKSLGVGRKLAHTGKHLWFACMRGDRKAWKMMCDYNKQDVILLEKVYLKLRPFITNHPNINTISRSMYACPACGGPLVRRGYHYTLTSEAQKFTCKDCHKWSVGRPERLSVKVNVR